MIVLMFFIILGCILFLIYFKKSKKRTSRKVLDLLKNQSVEISVNLNFNYVFIIPIFYSKWF